MLLEWIPFTWSVSSPLWCSSAWHLKGHSRVAVAEQPWPSAGRPAASAGRSARQQCHPSDTVCTFQPTALCCQSGAELTSWAHEEGQRGLYLLFISLITTKGKELVQTALLWPRGCIGWPPEIPSDLHCVPLCAALTLSGFVAVRRCSPAVPLLTTHGPNALQSFRKLLCQNNFKVRIQASKIVVLLPCSSFSLQSGNLKMCLVSLEKLQGFIFFFAEF